ncbi:MAG: polyprenyl synthetase family protein [Planctomycetota bacterium]
MLMLSKQDGETHATLARRLADVESRFGAELLSDLPTVNQLAEHVERYRGKMLRPTLVLASAMAAYPERADDEEFQEWTAVVATVAEMVHMATLVHDDILDEAEMRRRGATINHLRGNEAAVMLGDYLISHAYHLCSAIPLPAASRAIAAATNTVCEGELLQLHHRDDWALSERTYFEIIRRKTASLCGVCCRMPAVLASGAADGGAEPSAACLFDYGEKLGVAFQIVDDVLDLTGDPAEVGKTLGRDLAKGKLTLPLIHHLAGLGEIDRKTLMAELQHGADDAAVARLRVRLAEGESLDYTRQWAERLVGDAKQAIQTRLPESAALQLLLEMADAVLTRRY